MRKLSYWSRDHKNPARILILIGYLILNVTGLFLGDLVHSISGTFNQALILIPIILTIVGYIFYPKKKYKSIYKNFYSRQKLNDLLLIGSTFMFLTFIGNNTNSVQNIHQPLFASAIVFHPSRTIKPTTVSHSSKNLRQRFKAFRKAYKDKTKSQKTMAIIGILLLAGAMMVLIGALSCSIACSGGETLSIIVVIVGFVGVIFGASKIIKRINHGPKKPLVEEPLR
jgi:hypothetical protein